jgi:ankyrin repeat protein
VPDAIRSLPPSPDLRHLRNQAKDLLRGGGARSLAEAQFKTARLYGFESWPKLKAHVDLRRESGQLKDAIDHDDVDRVRQMMARRPSLHHAPLGYGGSGPLTWAAECRGQSEPSGARLEIAKWMIENGSDVHQGGDAPLMRAALSGKRTAMLDLLVAHGADVNARWNGWFPILFASCETVDPVAMSWLLQHGADPNVRGREGETALDYLLGTYVRSHHLARCIDVMTAAGGRTHFDFPAVHEVIAGRLDSLAERIERQPALVTQHWPELKFGATGARRLLLTGTTLLHVAAEYGNVEVARLLIARGADVNARAATGEGGIHGQTPLFHAVTQFHDWGLPVARTLLAAGADTAVRARVPGSYETDEFLDCSPLEYAQHFPGAAFPGSNAETLRLLATWQSPKP